MICRVRVAQRTCLPLNSELLPSVYQPHAFPHPVESSSSGATAPYRPAPPIPPPSHPDIPQATSPTSSSDSSLPQYGFGAEVAFEALIETNPFLFRVYTQKHSASRPASTSDDSDSPYFLAQRFKKDPLAPSSGPLPATYTDVAHHMDDSPSRCRIRTRSPYVLMWLGQTT